MQFGDFAAAGKVWVAGNGGQSQGPYTGKGIFGNGEFWSGTVWGDTATIEYQPTDPSDRRVPFQVRGIAHRAVAQVGSSRIGHVLAPAAATPPSDPAASCNLDVMCYDDWSAAAQMVSEIQFETEENGQQFEASCSASLVATRDNSLKPYLLTAGHCIHNETDARSVEAFWNYQKTACNGPAPFLLASFTSVGATYLTSGTLVQGDYSLLLLQSVPGSALFAGWDAGDPPVGTDLAGIHHPLGSYKRIVFGHRAGDEDVQLDDVTLPGSLYYILDIDSGIVQPGSSGSPLFSSPGVIVGTLTWGFAGDGEELCLAGGLQGGYGRFSNAYPQLKTWLEDLPYSEVVPSKPDVSFTVTDGVASADQTVQLTTGSKNPVTFTVRPDAPWIKLSAATTSTSASAPAPLSIHIDPKVLTQAGSFTSTVTILSGAAPPQFINVHVNVVVDRSNVTASASPNPVHQGSDGLWSYTVTLKETAGVSTHVTLLRIDGQDYSSQIASWFGTDHLAGGGSLSVPLKSRILLPPVTQTIEVGGMDDQSQKNWYRVFNVSLVQ